MTLEINYPAARKNARFDSSMTNLPLPESSLPLENPQQAPVNAKMVEAASDDVKLHQLICK